MPAPDKFHKACKNALLKDDWHITHDPLTLKWRKRDVFIDLAAEKVIAAEKEGQEIAIEIKSFVGKSPLHDLHAAVGQFVVYQELLQQLQPQRILYLAVREETYQSLFADGFGELLLTNKRIRLLVFNAEQEIITKWIS